VATGAWMEVLKLTTTPRTTPADAIFTGSSDIWWGCESAGDQEHAVVVGVAVAAGDASVEFDDAVDGFGAAVVRSAGGEVAQVLLLPLAQCLAQAGDLADRVDAE